MRPLITVIGSAPWSRAPQYQGCRYLPGLRVSACGWADPQWAEFMAEVARRFPQAAAIEVWNEPNMRGFYKPEPDPVRYAQLVRTAYNAIKEVDPDMTVLAGSLALAPQHRSRHSRHHPVHGDGRVPPEGVCREPLDQEPQRRDQLPYRPPQARLRSGKRVGLLLPHCAGREAAAGDAGKPIWMTETGLTLGSENPTISLTEQASGLLEQYRRIMTMPDMEAMYVHTLADRLEAPSPERDFGVIRSFSPFVPRPGSARSRAASMSRSRSGAVRRSSRILRIPLTPLTPLIRRILPTPPIPRIHSIATAART